MNEAHDIIEKALAEIDKLRIILKKKKVKQVYSREEKLIVKAFTLAWFNNHRKAINNVVSIDLLKKADELYKNILSASDGATTRAKYDILLKSIKQELSGLRAHTLMPSTSNQQSTNIPPQFGPLITDPQMQEILKRRWNECCNCLSGGAPLASVVMMGGLLEALLLARINKESNKAIIFGAKIAPIDKKTNKVLVLQEWTLRNYIDVAHELKWISQSAKDVGEILRDYRNYIHPYKELLHGIIVVEEDALILWEVTKSIVRQIIKFTASLKKS